MSFMFFRQFCAHCNLGGLNETSFKHAYTEILTQLVEICGQPSYQLDHGGIFPHIMRDPPGKPLADQKIRS